MSTAKRRIQRDALACEADALALWAAGMPVTASQKPGPLSEDDVRTLEHSLRRLHVELRAFLAALPVDAQTASGLARFLQVERTTCQRAVHAALSAFLGLELVRQLPGERGLRMLTDAALIQGGGDVAALHAAANALAGAIDEYVRAARHVASSRSELLRRISAQHGHGEPDAWSGDESRLRQMLFTAAAGLTGRYSETWLTTYIYEPLPGESRRIRITRVHGLVGHVAREQAVPLTFHVFGPSAANADAQPAEPTAWDLRPLEEAAGDGVPAEVLRAFSTNPVPIVHTKHPTDFLVQTLDAGPDQSPQEAVDVLFGMCGELPHPVQTPSKVEDVWALVNFPARRLLMDVFLHRDLARHCIPGLDVHLWRPDFASHAGERWQTRFATGPRLQVLGPGIEQADTDAYARYRELLAYLFAKRELLPTQYIGFRCDVPYPMWRTGYRMSFDFGESDTPTKPDAR